MLKIALKQRTPRSDYPLELQKSSDKILHVLAFTLFFDNLTLMCSSDVLIQSIQSPDSRFILNYE